MDVSKPATDPDFRAGGKVCPDMLVAEAGNAYGVGVGKGVNNGNGCGVRGAGVKSNFSA